MQPRIFCRKQLISVMCDICDLTSAGKCNKKYQITHLTKEGSKRVDYDLHKILESGRDMGEN